jgi:hypothetical protein
MTSAFSKPARSSSRRLIIISGVSGRGAFEFETRITALHRDDKCDNRNDKYGSGKRGCGGENLLQRISIDYLGQFRKVGPAVVIIEIGVCLETHSSSQIVS